jgi:hypothetical protein
VETGTGEVACTVAGNKPEKEKGVKLRARDPDRFEFLDRRARELRWNIFQNRPGSIRAGDPHKRVKADATAGSSGFNELELRFLSKTDSVGFFFRLTRLFHSCKPYLICIQ